MNYFNIIINTEKKRELILERKQRKPILNNLNLGKYFTRGDVLIVNFWAQTFRYHFEGLCLGVKNKNFFNPNVTVKLRNVLYGTGLELTVSYFMNRLYKNITMADFRRKGLSYKQSKLFFLRNQKNKASKINKE